MGYYICGGEVGKMFRFQCLFQSTIAVTYRQGYGGLYGPIQQRTYDRRNVWQTSDETYIHIRQSIVNTARHMCCADTEWSLSPTRVGSVIPALVWQASGTISSPGIWGARWVVFNSKAAGAHCTYLKRSPMSRSVSGDLWRQTCSAPLTVTVSGHVSSRLGGSAPVRSETRGWPVSQRRSPVGRAAGLPARLSGRARGRSRAGLADDWFLFHRPAPSRAQTGPLGSCLARPAAASSDWPTLPETHSTAVAGVRRGDHSHGQIFHTPRWDGLQN